MSILIKGIGSIGKRHLNNLLNLGYTDVVLISSKLKQDSPFDRLPVYSNVEAASKNHSFSHGFICSPTASHQADLKSFIGAGVPKIYLEKPVSHQVDGLEFVQPFLKTGGQVFVGYDLHFDPGLEKVRELIAADAIGQVIGANAFVGQYLPDWRPHEDHRLGMSASKAKGGGVMLDLVHEFDYFNWLFGLPKKVAAFYQHNKSLEIETEDVADVLLKYESGMSGSIHLDYHQHQLIRHCIITGSKGTITWDLAARKVSYINASKNIEAFDFNSFDRNDRFIAIVKAFMDGINDDRLTQFNQGLASLELVLAAKKSSETNSIITI